MARGEGITIIIYTSECAREDYHLIGIANGCFIVHDTEEDDTEISYEAIPMDRIISITFENKDESMEFINLAWKVGA